MAKVTSPRRHSGQRFIVDYSPPRSTAHRFAEELRGLPADFISVAYSPGRAVRMDPLSSGLLIKREAGVDVVVNFSTRDMNRLALQMQILGADALGLENVLVVRGDDFSAKDQSRVKTVQDYKPTEFIAGIKAMNKGVDFRGAHLASPTNLCVGAIIDLGGDIERQVALTMKKVDAGADYFITQAVYDVSRVEQFWRAYERIAGKPIKTPVFYGAQMLMRGGVAFGEPPLAMLKEIEDGRSSVEQALELLKNLGKIGCRDFYIVPPIYKGGARDYKASAKVIASMRER